MKNILVIALLTMMWASHADAKEVTYADILANASKFVGKSITMSGIFMYAEPMRGSFTFEQNSNLIEVFYGDLPQKDKDLIASQRQDAKAPVIVTGILQRYTNSTDKYFMNASSLQIAGGSPRLMPVGSTVLYSSIRLNPSKYLGKTVTMTGVFSYNEPARGSFIFDQNGDLIEVFYGDLPQQDKDFIGSQKQTAKTPVVVTGIVQSYTDGANKYFLKAVSVGVGY